MSRTPSPITPREASLWARQGYGIEAVARELPAEYASNFLLEDGSGAKWIFKVAPEDLSDDALDLQNKVLRHLENKKLKLATPRLVPSLAGEDVVRRRDAAGRERRIRVLSFVPGVLWVDVPQRGAKLLRQLGENLAKLDVALADFRHPAAAAHHDWDLRHAQRKRRDVKEIRDPRRRVLAEAVFQLHAARALPLLEKLPRSVIHGDANDYNLVVRVGKKKPRLSGIIDFGDLVETLTICDLAVALAFAMMGEEDPLAAAAEVVAGYNPQRPLSSAELEVLFPLACARLAITTATAARRRRTRPENEYLFVSEAPAWAVLEKLAAVTPAEAEDRFRAACGLAGRSPAAAPEVLLERRKGRIGPSLSVSYGEPLSIVRGRGQFLIAHDGRPYLDLVNNVCHVGHCHPRVVAAAGRQMEVLNTNTRYLYGGLTDYADRLCGTLPAPLSVCYFVCSGSEANELALRLARAHTGRKDLLVLEGAYHGHTSTLIDASPYKFLGAGGRGEAEPWVHMVPVPDGYRGPHKGQGRDTGLAYAAEVQRVIEGSPRPIGAYIAESLLGCGGQIVPPEAYLGAVYGHVRDAGGVCIADEVQVGFGRVGKQAWGFELQAVVPDIVVLGKPIGNGHPMAAVVTTPRIAASFANGMEFFSTFGGNPVSCAVGMAVLDVVEDEGLQAHALEIGTRLLDGFRQLQASHPLIGDVRGEGLFLGLELVRERETLEPAPEETRAVVERMKELGVLLSIDGPLHNVIKIKPPMVLTAQDADMVVRCLDQVLGESWPAAAGGPTSPPSDRA